ncbi:CBS domain-containing protein [Streptomyces parvulus]|uniref:CBS domain-containing protein n=1 Tax=Streptomyces parvulus TaxID=146923 RepID=UPI00368E927F
MADRVKDVMTPGVAAVRPGSSLVEAARLMCTQDVGDVVVADGREVVGMLTDRHIAVRAVARGLDPMAVNAGAVCDPDPPTAAPDEPVARVAALMREHGVRRVAVVEDGLPVGTVGAGDLPAVQDPGSASARITRPEPDTRPGA